MATDQYAVGSIFVDGQLLAEEISIDLTYSPNNNIIVTQQKGFAGISPGAGRFTCKCSSAIPRAGLEVDFYQLAKDRQAVELLIHAGGVKRISKGFIMNVDEKFAADSPSSIDFDFEGDEPELS